MCSNKNKTKYIFVTLFWLVFKFGKKSSRSTICSSSFCHIKLNHYFLKWRNVTNGKCKSINIVILRGNEDYRKCIEIFDKGGFFSESINAFVISSNTWTFYFPELKNLNFWDFKGCASQRTVAFLPLQASKLSNLKTFSISKQISVTKIQNFKLRKIKGSYLLRNDKCINTFWKKNPLDRSDPKKSKIKRPFLSFLKMKQLCILTFFDMCIH